MLLPPLRSAGTAMLLGVAVSACQDLPTTPLGAEGASPSSSNPGIGGGIAFSRSGHDEREPQFVCYTSKRDSESPIRYRYGRLTVRLPRSAESSDGSTMIYRYVRFDESNGTDVLEAANCRIPRTPEAVRVMNRRLGLIQPRENGKGSGNNGDMGEITTLSDNPCPTGCPIEGIIARGYAFPYSSYPSIGTGWDQGGWGSSYYETGEGSGSEPYTPNPQAEDPCNTGDTFLDDPAVNAGFDHLWQTSNPTANIAHRVEQIGWIVKTATGHRIQQFATGNFCGWEGETPYPEEGPDAIVGFIHTHPYAVGETIIGCGVDGGVTVETYQGVPSDPDRAASIRLGQILGRSEPLAGLILDANGIRTFKGNDPEMNGTLARCGY